VARLLGDHGENQEAQFAVIEQPAAMSFAVMMSVMSPVAMISDLVLGMTVVMGVVSMMMMFHDSCDIDHDMTKVKIYRNGRQAKATLDLSTRKDGLGRPPGQSSASGWVHP
jgi:hypothetical protein